MKSFKEYINEDTHTKVMDFANHMMLRIAQQYGKPKSMKEKPFWSRPQAGQYTVVWEHPEIDVNNVLNLFKNSLKNYDYKIETVKTGATVDVFVKHADGHLESMAKLSPTKIMIRSHMEVPNIAKEIFGN